MWERHIKNQFGSIKEVQSSKSFCEKKTVTDRLTPNEKFNYNPAGVEVKYIVESLNKRNEQAFEDSQLVGSHVNPWELFDQFFTDSFGLAIHELLVRTIDPDIVNEPQLTMYINCNGKDAEVTAELPSTTRYTIRNLVEKEANDRITSLSRELETLKDEYVSMLEFIKKCHAEKLYREFKEDKANDV